jgi:3-dehydroquinate dehydratase-1/3-dehydroquinate dehydratase/shikimate dehydrogenase
MVEGQQARVCAAVGVDQIDEAVRLVAQESRHADLVEVRLDTLDEPGQIDLNLFFEAASGPLLFTLRPDWEGGHYRGAEAERVELLAQACRAGAAYIDCELRAPLESRRHLRRVTRETGTQLILSYHDFTSTPSAQTLSDVLRQMVENDADIAKIVSTADNHLDVLRVLGLQSAALDQGLPLIAFCMGTAGVISRVATVRLGGFMTYCAAGSNIETAPGQLTVRQLRDILDRIG